MPFDRYPDYQYVDVVGREGNNGILLAATEEDGLNTIKWLERRDVAIGKINRYGRTALMEAALWGRLETVNYLVAKGVNINAVDTNGH
jgi:ankyrin repeat protein